MRLPVLLLGLAAAVLLAAACSEEEEATPAACLSPAGTYLQALRAAPGEVLLDGETPIHECVIPDQDAGELSTVGGSVVEAATRLNGEARADPGGPQAVQLGYLVGAVQQGAEDTSGIHTDLIRRLDTAGRFAPGGEQLPIEFERTFGRGYAAGQESG